MLVAPVHLFVPDVLWQSRRLVVVCAISRVGRSRGCSSNSRRGPVVVVVVWRRPPKVGQFFHGFIWTIKKCSSLPDSALSTPLPH